MQSCENEYNMCVMISTVVSCVVIVIAAMLQCTAVLETVLLSFREWMIGWSIDNHNGDWWCYYECHRCHVVRSPEAVVTARLKVYSRVEFKTSEDRRLRSVASWCGVSAWATPARLRRSVVTCSMTSWKNRSCRNLWLKTATCPNRPRRLRLIWQMF